MNTAIVEEEHKRLVLARKPVGLVLDDEPDPLLQSLEHWMKDQWSEWLVPTFEVPTSEEISGNLDHLVSTADFVLLDNRFNRPLGGYTRGLELGKQIRSMRNDLPIFYYTAFSEDWRKPGRSEVLRDEISNFQRLPGVNSYLKHELATEERRADLCHEILKVIALRPSPHDATYGELLKLVSASVDRVVEHRLRMLRFDRRAKYQILRNIDSPTGDIMQVPTELLLRAGVGRKCDVLLRVVEYDGGQVLSYIVADRQRDRTVAREIIDLLEEL